MGPESLWSFSLLSIPDTQAEHIRRRIFSGNNSIPFPDHKQDGLLFKTSELKKMKISEKTQRYNLLEIQWVCYSQTGYLICLQIWLICSSKINQKRGKWCCKYHTGPSWPSPTTLSCFLRTYSLYVIYFPVPSVLVKGNVFAHWEQNRHQQLSQTNHHELFSETPRKESNAITWRPNSKELWQFSCH